MRIAKRLRLLMLVMLAGPTLYGCDDAVVTSPGEVSTSDPVMTNVAVTDGDGFTRIDGEKAGALFAVIQPDDWNGDLVLLMHGLVPEPSAPNVLIPPIQWWINPVADALVDRGFGVALSSYRVNGHAVKEGVLDTRIAQDMFTANFDRPSATYLIGWSMGGSVGEMLLETSPKRYDGFLAVCSRLAGTTASLRYHVDARVLFDHFFPGVFPWSVWNDQQSLFGDVLPALQTAFVADPAGFVEKGRKLASMDQLDLPLGSGTPEELLLAILGSLVSTGGGAADLVQKANGIPIDNTETDYTSGLLTEEELAELNASVERFDADPQAARFLERYYTPDGRIQRTPVLALHTDGDAVVPPANHLPVYEGILEAAGNGEAFVARVVEGFGHCEFGGDLQPDAFLDVQLEAFDELVAWARGGPKPAP